MGINESKIQVVAITNFRCSASNSTFAIKVNIDGGMLYFILGGTLQEEYLRLEARRYLEGIKK